MVGRICTLLAVSALAFSSPVVAHAQSVPPVRSLAPSAKRESVDGVPLSHLPPAGMCRVWIDNVPPAQQPAPTDCPTAIRNRPPNARVIFSDDNPRDRSPDKRDKGDRGRRGDDERDKDKRDAKRKKPDGNVVS
jgi:hypothetical protein